VKWYWWRKSLRGARPVPLWTPQISHVLTWDRTRFSAWEAGDWPPESWHGHVQHKVHVNNMYQFSSQLTVNALHFQYQYVPTNYCCVGFVPDLRLSPRCGWGLMLQGVDWQLATDVSGQHIDTETAVTNCRRAKGYMAISCVQYTVQNINMLSGQCRMGGTYSYHCAVKGLF
jgi:hypothetical protein